VLAASDVALFFPQKSALASTAARMEDEELRGRLLALGYNVPPITESTRGVLVKKLRQAEAEAARAARKGQNKALLDYSSAEEEASTSARGERGVIPKGVKPLTPYFSRTESTRRRISSSSRPARGAPNGHPGRVRRGQTPTSAGRTSPRKAIAVNGHGRRTRAKAMLGYSEGEEDAEDEEEVDDSDDQLEDDEDEEEELDEEEADDGSEEDEEEEEEEEFARGGGRVDFGGQTSPGMDESLESPGGLRLRRGSRGGRFASSTPMGSAQPSPSGSSPSPSRPSPHGFTLKSPHLRKMVMGKEFGSLGEALSSYPAATTSYSYSNGGGGGGGGGESVVTQVAPPSPSPPLPPVKRRPATAVNVQRDSPSRLTSSLRSLLGQWNAPKVILCAALAFFALLAVKYSSLRPTVDIANKLVICGESGE